MPEQSGLPPRPAGLPLKPPGRPYDLGDYRPLPPPPPLENYSSFPDRQPYPRRNDDMYHFRGAYNVDRPPGVDRSPNPLGRPGVRPASRSEGDSYRPRQDEFTFRAEPPPLDFRRPSDQYRDRSPRPIDRRRDHNDHRIIRGNNWRDRHPQSEQSRDFKGRGGFSQKAAERPMLQTKRDRTPELMFGMEDEEKCGVKFRAVEDMSDSEEADMDLSSDGEGGLAKPSTSDEPKKKHVRTDFRKSADDDSVPRWSNPDPYTVLPPVDETQRKKKDVVKLIRKARIATALDDAPKPEATSDDFISFDFGDEPEDETNDEDPISNSATDLGLANVPTGPRSSDPVRKNLSHENSNPNNSKQLNVPTGAGHGGRKRTIDGEIKGQEPNPPNKPGKREPVSGSILEKWAVRAGTDSTPWCTVDHSLTKDMGVWLHKEIMDFYYRYMPTDYEYSIRQKLVERLSEATKRRWPDADVKPFGSFVAGLFLPTADMDIVFVSKFYLSGRGSLYHDKDFLYEFRDFLSQNGFSTGAVELVTRAKVPLVKYVDKVTGLKVDVSFENDTGLIANDTFQTWKRQYPAMPILVTLIKQFLAMRGLNEPINGGIGGFSVTCLVVSLLDLLPQVQSGNMIPEHHLGEILMEFFDLYGNEFNAATTAIKFNPSGYVQKRQPRGLNYRNVLFPKLSIIDPNDPSNDISGGSKNTSTILKAFSRAFYNLRNRMSDLNFTPVAERKGESILRVILEGNYSSFDTQREQLRKCYESLTRSHITDKVVSDN